MPSFSAIVRSPAGIKPVATNASHPSAAAATVSNCAATNSAATRGASAGDDGFAPCTSARTDWPTGTSGTPTRASSSAKSGGAHTRTSAPSSRNRTASATIGSTSPRDPHVDNNTRISLPHFREFWPRPAILRHDPGLAASPPVRYMLKVEGVVSPSLFFSFIVVLRSWPSLG